MLNTHICGREAQCSYMLSETRDDYADNDFTNNHYADVVYENANYKDDYRAESGALMLRAAPFMPENCLEVSLSTFESLFKSL